jgi:alpha-glucosidase
MLAIRKQFKLGEGSFDWLSQGEALSYKNGSVTVIHNFSSQPIALPEGKLLLSSLPLNAQGQLNSNDTAWVLN